MKKNNKKSNTTDVGTKNFFEDKSQNTLPLKLPYIPRSSTKVQA